MKRTTLLLLLATCFSMFGCRHASASPFLFDFDDGTLQGWTARPFFGGTLSNPGAGGNPGGYVLATDSVPLGGDLFATAPVLYTGDLSLFLGVRWDEFVFVRGAGGSATVRPTDVFITGGPNSTTYRLANNPLTLIGQWQTRFVTFDSGSFSIVSGTDSFDSVIQNVTEFNFSLDTSTRADGGPESGFDNVTLVAAIPEPSSLILLCVAATGFYGVRSRRRFKAKAAT